MIKDLVYKGRSVRNFDRSPVIRQTLEELVDVARLCPCGANKQPLRYYLSCTEEENEKIFAETHWAAMLKDVKLPFEGKEPAAYIVICTDITIWKDPKASDMDTGIAAQSMMLAAVEKGLNGCFLATFSTPKVQEILQLPEHLVPRLILALGTAAEKVEIVPVPKDGNTAYYRDGDTHYVPKRSLDDVVINRR